MLRVSVLGAVEADHDGQRVALRGPKQRALLAILALEPNRVVSRDRLIDGLWGEQPPPGVEHALDTQISMLRRSLGGNGDGSAAPVGRTAPGYALQTEKDAVDVERFDRLTAAGREALGAGRNADAAALLRDALALWRGPPLEDVISVPFASAAARELEERRLGAVEDRTEADIAVGLGPELVVELERLVAEHPLQERLVGFLMVALYRAGRRARALEVMASARRRLAEELGLQPGPALRDIEAGILREDPALLPAANGRPRPAAERRPSARRWIAPGAATAALAIGAAVALLAGRGADPAPSAPDAAGVAAFVAASGRFAGAAALPGAPAAIVADASGIWVADPDDNLVARVDPESRAVTARVALPSAPAALTAGDGAIWAASALAGTVTRIDPGTQRVTQTIRVGGSPTALAFGDRAVWVGDQTGRVLRLDAATGRRELAVAVDDAPTSIAVDRQTVWVASNAAGTVTALRPESGARVTTTRVGGGPVAIVAGHGGGPWVANALDATVSRLDAQGDVRATIPVGGGPAALTFAGGSLWVANEFAGTVSRIDPRRGAVTQTLRVGAGPTAVALGGERLWVGTRPTGAEHRGGTLRLVASGAVQIDPQFNLFFPAPQFLGLAYDGLVTLRHAGGPRGVALVPDLAVALPTPTSGGTRYTFRLRPGIRYSTGAPVRASDFVRAIERLFRGRSRGVVYFEALVGARRCEDSPATCRLTRGVVADDAAGTVEFRLRAPDRDFLYRLAALTLAAPAPPGTPDRETRSRPIPGTGPYRIASVHGGVVRFVRNSHFREWSHAAQPAGYPDEVVWRLGGTSLEQKVRAAEDGRADWVFGSIPPDMITRIRNRAAARLHVNEMPATDFVQLNTRVTPFDDVRVRRALNYALDRRAVAREYGGPEEASPACQVLPPGMRAYRPYCPYTRAPRAEGAWTAPDVARARQLVAASGTRGTRVSVLRLSDDVFPPAGIAAIAARALRRIGYRARVRVLTHDRYDALPAREKAAVQAGTASWLADYLSPSNFLEPWIACRGPFNAGRVCDPALDRRIDRAHALEATDPIRADALWVGIDRTAVDAAFWVPLVNPHDVELVSKRLGNYQYNALLGFLADQAWVR
jgi:ABC-type transport system substrate-binding protein/DNA-binding SARP family transcriptional activator